MVAIRHTTRKAPDPVHERRVRTFFMIYGALTLALPIVAVILPHVGWKCFIVFSLLILGESLFLAGLVQMGHDEDTECRWLGYIILARIALVLILAPVMMARY